MKSEPVYPLLESVDLPADLRDLDEAQLPALADELRQFLINSVSKTGGHLAAGLGTVELTLALHYIYDTPADRLVWDVGHQTYPHKILTGRREAMASLRQQGGLSGFPKRDESEFDTFGVGHSSTSISAALGMAVASARKALGNKVVAIIGDGALSAGMAFEALNNAGDADADLLVILNDNDMSISNNVGAMSSYLTRILSGKVYTSMREGSKTVLSTMRPMWELAKRAEEHVKGMLMPGTLFEELGFQYFGPIDGHDLKTLIPTLRNLAKLKGPRFLHVVTTKGKGFKPAENNPCFYHGVTAFDPATGEMASKKSGTKTYTQVFGNWLCDMATRDDRLVAITPAMCEGSGMVEFSKKFSDRYFDVGIAEQHALTFAAGLACEGIKPVVAIYSTFLQRAYDQLIHDICLQKLPVMLAIDRAGIVGADGATHAGSFDLSFLRTVPNITIMTPADENECRIMLTTGFLLDGPAAVRYPRGEGIGVNLTGELVPIPVGEGEIRRSGQRVAILAFGPVLNASLEAGEKLNATVVNMRFVKPLDGQLIEELAKHHELIVTIEENAVAGGAGSGVAEHLAAAGITTAVIHIGLPDDFVNHGSQEEIRADFGLDAAGIHRQILRALPAQLDGILESAYT